MYPVNFAETGEGNCDGGRREAGCEEGVEVGEMGEIRHGCVWCVEEPD